MNILLEKNIYIILIEILNHFIKIQLLIFEKLSNHLFTLFFSFIYNLSIIKNSFCNYISNLIIKEKINHCY